MFMKFRCALLKNKEISDKVHFNKTNGGKADEP